MPLTPPQSTSPTQVPLTVVQIHPAAVSAVKLHPAPPTRQPRSQQPSNSHTSIALAGWLLWYLGFHQKFGQVAMNQLKRLLDDTRQRQVMSCSVLQNLTEDTPQAGIETYALACECDLRAKVQLYL